MDSSPSKLDGVEHGRGWPASSKNFDADSTGDEPADARPLDSNPAVDDSASVPTNEENSSPGDHAGDAPGPVEGTAGPEASDIEDNGEISAESGDVDMPLSDDIDPESAGTRTQTWVTSPRAGLFDLESITVASTGSTTTARRSPIDGPEADAADDPQDLEWNYPAIIGTAVLTIVLIVVAVLVLL